MEVRTVNSAFFLEKKNLSSDANVQLKVRAELVWRRTSSYPRTVATPGGLGSWREVSAMNSAKKTAVILGN
jgi:hypothetical protein